MDKPISDIRRDYTASAGLHETDVDPDPFKQFTAWFNAALESNIIDANAMTLATATPEGIPSARILLLKGIEANSLTFFTNYQSLKGQQLTANPNAEMLFFWAPLERQVRIAGRIEAVSAAESDAYFQSRPRESQIGAWVSNQSEVVESMDILQQRYMELAEQYQNAFIPRPPYWGGYRLLPKWFEFWQGRASRLHDRLRYIPDESAIAQWRVERLSP